MNDGAVRVLLVGDSVGSDSAEAILHGSTRFEVVKPPTSNGGGRLSYDYAADCDVVLVANPSKDDARGLLMVEKVRAINPHIQIIVVNPNGNARLKLDRAWRPHVSKIISADDAPAWLEAAATCARLEAELQLRERERNWFRGLLTVSQSITTSLVPSEIAREIYRQLSRLIPAMNSFYIATFDEKRDELRFMLTADGGKTVDRLLGSLSNKEDWGLAGRIVRSRVPLLIQDTFAVMRRRQFRRFNGGQPARTYFGLPLLSGDKIVGVMSAQSYSPHAFDEGQRQFIQAIANHTAVAMENALLHQEQSSRRLLMLSKLCETMGAIRGALGVPEVLDLIVGHLHELFRLDTCTIGFVDPEMKRVEVIAERGISRRVTRELKKLPQELVRRVFASSDPIEIENVGLHPALRRALVRSDINSLVILPLHGKQDLHGVITMGSKTPLGLAPEQKKLLRALSDQAAIAIEKARLRQQNNEWAAQLESLSRMTLDIAHSTRRDELLRAIIRVAASLLRSPGGGLYMLTEAGDELVLEERRGLPEKLEKIRFRPGKSVIGRVLTDSKPFAVSDYRHWPHRLRRLDSLNLTAVVGAPIVCDGELMGVIAVNDSKEGRAYTEAEKKLLSSFAEHAGAAIQRADKTLKERAELIAEEELCARVTQALTVELDYRALLRKVAELLREHLGYRYCTLFLQVKFADELHVAVQPTYHGPVVTSIKVGKGVVGHVAATGKPKIVPDVQKEPLYKPGLGAGSEIAVPLKLGDDEVIGVLDVESEEPRAFGERDERILTRVAAHLSIAIENARRTSESAEKTARLTALANLSEAIARSRSLNDILQTVAQEMLKACPASFCHIMLRTRDEKRFLRVRASHPARRQPKLDWNPQTGRVCQMLTDPRLAKLLQRAESVVFKRKRGSGLRFIRDFERHVSLKGRLDSALLIPLRGNKGRVIGLCVLGEMRRWERSSFTQENIHFASTLASQAAVAVEKERGKELAAERTLTMESLHKVGNALTGTLELKKVLNMIVRSGRKLLNAEVFSIFLVRREGWLTLETSSGSAPAATRGVRVQIEKYNGLTGHIAKVGRLFNQHGPALITHPAVKTASLQPHLPSKHCHALIGIPLRRRKGSRNDIIGLIKVENKLDRAGRVAPSRGFDKADTVVLKTLASYAETALQNVELFNLADRAKEAAETVNSTLDMDVVLDHVLAQLKKLIPFDTASIQLLQGGGLRIVACTGFNRSDKKKVLNLNFPLTQKFPNLRVLKHKRPYRVPDIRATRYRHFWDEADVYCSGAIRSWIGVPLLRRGKAIGMISIENNGDAVGSGRGSVVEPRPYTSVQENLAMAFARQVASAVENAHIYKTTQSLLDMVIGLTEDLDLQVVLRKLARNIVDKDGIIRADSAVIYLHDPDLDVVEGEPVCAGLTARERGYINIKHRPYSAVRRLVYAKAPRLPRDIRNDPLLYRGFARRVGIKAVGVFPLRVGAQPVGVMYVNYLSPHRIDGREKELLQMIAKKAALTIQHARKYKVVSERLETTKSAARNLYTLSALGHDARKIRYSILGNLKLLENSMSRPTPRASEYLRKAKHFALSLGELPDHPTDLDQITDIRLSDVYESVLKKCSEEVKQKQLKVRADLQSLPPVRANSWLLSQAFHNLTQNAVKAVGKHGAIRIRGHVQGGSVIVEFVDNGPGIPPKVKKYLFKRRVPGGNKAWSGYGLLLSRAYLNACDGDLTLRHTDARGTTFALNLPAAG